MAGDTYLFIDGGHLRKYHGETVSKWFGIPAPDLNLRAVGSNASAQKCFYYDCLDDIKRPTESETDFKIRLAQQEELFSRFRRTENTHVRLGTLTGQGKKIRQKQVDILLAVDAMNHAARGNMRSAVLVAGDQDFTPLVEALVNMGLSVQVWGDIKHTSTTLADAADIFRPLRFIDYFNWSSDPARRNMPLPALYIGGVPAVNVSTSRGTVAGMPATLLYHEGKYWVIIDSPEAKLNSSDYALIAHDADKSRV